MKCKIPIRSLAAQLRRDRQVAAGRVATKPWFSSRRQRTAARLLAGFFAMMLLCTIISRVSASLTMATVTVVAQQGGSLSQKYTLEGTIESSRTQTVALPDGIVLTSVWVQPGSRVAAGDPLLELEPESLTRVKESLQQEIAVLDIRIQDAASGSISADDTVVELAETTLKNAQEDYDRLLEQQELEQQRAEKDLTDAKTSVTEAESNLKAATVKAQQQLLEAAQTVVSEAELSLEDAEYAREDAIASADAMVQSARQAVDSADAAYDSAVSALSQANSALSDAQRELANAQDGGDPTLIAAAQQAVSQAQSAVTAARGQKDAAEIQQSSAAQTLRTAKETLERQKERQNQLVDHASAALDEARKKLLSVEQQTDFSGESLVINAQTELDAATDQVDALNRSNEDLERNHEEQRLSAERNIQSSQTNVKSAQNTYANAQQSDASAQRQRSIEMLQYKSEQAEKKQMLTLLDSFTDGIVTAPVSGTVETVAEAASTTQAGSPVLVLNCDEETLSFVATVDEETARYLTVGTSGSLLTQTDNAMAIPAEITAVNLPDSNGMVRISASVSEQTQTLTAGSKATLDITGQSSQYRVVVPISALRSVNGKTVVYVVRETETVIGTEPRIVAVEVQTKETTPSSAAIEGALSAEDRIVSSSNKPIAEGDRVRVET